MGWPPGELTRTRPAAAVEELANGLIIEPIRAGRRAKVKAATQRAMAAHDQTLRRLAR